MAANVTFDPISKIMYVTTVPITGVEVSDPNGYYVDLDVKVDFYSDAKEDWLSDPYLAQFRFPMASVGGDPLPGSKALGSTYFLEYGWKIRPYPSNHTFRINGNIYSRDGSSPFVAPLSGSVTIINTVSSLVDSTLQQLPQIEYASFQNQVTIDVINGSAGTEFPIGTPEYPVNNLDDAKLIADNRGFDTFYIIGNITITDLDDVSDYILIGQGASTGFSKTTIIMLSGCTTSNTIFENARVEGYQGGEGNFHNCVIGELFDTHCTFKECIMLGPVHQYAAGWTPFHTTTLRDCVTSKNWYNVDFDGSGLQQSYTGFEGKIRFSNMTNPNAYISLNMVSGIVWIDDTCTAGTVDINGTGTLMNESAGTTVNASDLMNKTNISDAVWERTSGIQRLIESQNRVPMFGEFFYVNYTEGSSANDGLTPETPVHSVQYAHDNLIEAGRGDMIFLINAGSQLNIDEQWHFTKHHFAIRCDGWDTTLSPTATAGATITVDADEIALEGFQVRCNATEGPSANQVCIKLESGADNCTLKNLKVKYSHEGGVEVYDSDGLYVSDCVLEHHSGTACIHLRGDSHECIFENNFIYDASMGIMVHDTARENWVKKNLFHDMAYGVMIMDSTVRHLYIDKSNIFANMGTEVVNNVGAEGIFYQWQEEADYTAQSVWDVSLSGHAVHGSTGTEVLKLAYDHGIHYDAINGVAGDTYPIGTHGNSVNNYDDFLSLSEKYDIKIAHIHTDFIVPSGADFSGWEFSAHNLYTQSVVLCAGCITENCEFHEVGVTGYLNGTSFFDDCLIYNIYDFSAHAIRCSFWQDIHFKTSTSYVNIIEDSTSYRRGTTHFYLNDSTQNFVNWTGSAYLHDKTSDTEFNAALHYGGFVVMSSCISGSMKIVGQGKVIDSSGGTTIDTTDLLNVPIIADAIWDEQLGDHTTGGSAGYALGNVSAGANPLDIANAVWQHTTSKSLTADVQFIKLIEGGRWSIDGTQMVFYATDNTTEIARFNLFDSNGLPSNTEVFHRFRL